MVGNRGRSIHRDTVINCLRERGIHCRRPARCQALTQRHRLERQRWALNNRRRASPGLTFTMLMGGFKSTDVVMNALQTSAYVKCTNTAVGASWSGQRSIPIFAFLNRVSLYRGYLLNVGVR